LEMVQHSCSGGLTLEHHPGAGERCARGYEHERFLRSDIRTDRSDAPADSRVRS